MKNKLCIILVLKNIVSIICFTILAIVFNKWWLIFFSILFLTNFDVTYDTKEDEEDVQNRN